jgi:DNA-binding MarR family transcriptional regulator
VDEDRHESAIVEAAVVWQPIPPADSHSGYWLRNADRRLTKTLARLLAQVGIIASEWTALRTLYGPQWRSPMELGQMIGMSKGGASKLVTRLVKKGLIEKRRSKFDRRRRSVGLTRQGRDFVARLAAVVKDTDREFFQPLGNNRKFWLRQWMSRVLTHRHQRRMDDWMSQRMKQHGIARVDPQAVAKAAAQREADAEAFWQYCKQVGEAAAYGRPPPPTPAFLKIADA